MTISDSDLERTSEHSWCSHACGYAKARVDGKYVLFHRWLLNAKDGEQIDHINGDKLDNRRENLRFCTASQNSMNRAKASCNSSGYKGVDYREEKKKFRARLSKKFLGYYPTAEKAAIAYNEAALEQFGAFAQLNVIPQEYSQWT